MNILWLVRKCNLTCRQCDLGPVFAGFVRGSKPTNCPNLKFITAFGLRSTLEFGATKSPNLDPLALQKYLESQGVQIWTCNFEFWLSNSKSEVSKVVHGFFPNCGSPWIFSEWMSPFMDFFRIVGYTEGFRSYRIGLLAFLALCRKMNSPQILNANPTKSPNLEFGQLVGFRPLHKSGKYWAL